MSNRRTDRIGKNFRYQTPLNCVGFLPTTAKTKYPHRAANGVPSLQNMVAAFSASVILVGISTTLNIDKASCGCEYERKMKKRDRFYRVKELNLEFICVVSYNKNFVITKQDSYALHLRLNLPKNCTKGDGFCICITGVIP